MKLDNTKPLVSIIMNCHNGAKYLSNSIESILRQNYVNWELIFFDNNSNDNSRKILKSYKDKRIRYFFSKKKINLYHARNLALKKTKGKYVSFLDVDDLWDKKKLKLQIDYLKKNKEYKIIYSNYMVLDETTNKKYNKYFKNLESGYVTQSLLNNYTLGILTVLFEKKIIQSDCFNKSYNVIGDFDCFLKLSLKNKIAYISKPLAVYRIHGDNYSIKNLNQYIEELKNWIKKNSNIYKKFTFFYLNYYLNKLRIKLFLKSILGM